MNDLEIETDVNKVFERFRTWLQERELPSDDKALSGWMYMCSSKGHYQMKNRNTRNYIFVNIEPKAFNL
jgi:hypothetical protein